MAKKRSKKFDGHPLMIRLPAELRSRLEKLAEADQRTLSDYIRRVLEGGSRRGGARKPVS